ncbi:MAG: PDZ domain-containing protein [Planctomycetota bacterium]
MKRASNRLRGQTLGVAVLLAAVASASADDRDPTPADLVADLGHPDYAVRQAATDALLIDPSLTPDELAALAPPDAGPEVRHRLLGVARHHFLRRLRLETFPADGPASLGVVQSAQNPTPTDQPDTPAYVLVTRVLPGFPATGRLRPFDRVLALDGRPLLPDQNFPELMRRYRAGQQVVVTVERADQTLDLAVPLANKAALVEMYAQPGHGLTPVFGRRWEHVLRTTLAPLSSSPDTPSP